MGRSYTTRWDTTLLDRADAGLFDFRYAEGGFTIEAHGAIDEPTRCLRLVSRRAPNSPVLDDSSKLVEVPC